MVSGAEEAAGTLSTGDIKEIGEGKLVIYHMVDADPATEKEFVVKASTVFCVDDKIVNEMDSFTRDRHVGILADRENGSVALYVLGGAFELAMAGMTGGFVSMDAMPFKSKCR